MIPRWLRLRRIALHAGRDERHDERRESSGYLCRRDFQKSNCIEENDCQLPNGDRASFRNGWGRGFTGVTRPGREFHLSR